MTERTEKAILAGGCFWGMQDLIRKRPGVLSTRVGYTGGDVANATYRNHGTHAEAIEITFDPERTSYRDLLEFFFQIHDPTTLDRQGNDMGRATAQPSSISTMSSVGSPRTPLPTSRRPGYGPARWSQKSHPRAPSGRRSQSTRTTWSATPTATPVTSPVRAGCCLAEARRSPDDTLVGIGGRAGPSGRAPRRSPTSITVVGRSWRRAPRGSLPIPPGGRARGPAGGRGG